MKPGSAGATEVSEAALDLAHLLPRLHPVPKCQRLVAATLAAVAPDASPEQVIQKVAEACWICLPGRFSEADFEHPFTAAAVSDRLRTYAARRAGLRHRGLERLGACRESPWGRTCSYWAALHGLAWRADLEGLSDRFFRTAATLLAGGATLCGGCTIHFRILHDHLLTENVRKDFGETFCANTQCAAAKQHTKTLQLCLRTTLFLGECDRRHQEMADLLAYRNATGSGLILSSAAVTFAVLHNIVTASVADRYNGPRRRFYCASDVISSMDDAYQDGSATTTPAWDSADQSAQASTAAPSLAMSADYDPRARKQPLSLAGAVNRGYHADAGVALVAQPASGVASRLPGLSASHRLVSCSVPPLLPARTGGVMAPEAPPPVIW
eukprot:TRINITY_DN24620_c0_g1_i2.p1 TRINITY_DN24620_c0_g1~~TRINITY_DN24620_c0_g1_i2.p1  ORF type:complete len:383 (-),score=63.82 TRINITY_DN24620_c0_g1_i2:51-1199(-)